MKKLLLSVLLSLICTTTAFASVFNSNQIASGTPTTGFVPQSIGNNLPAIWVSTSTLGISSAVWGMITGTLSNQTDLQNALNLLVPYFYASSTFVSFPYASSTFPSFAYASTSYVLVSASNTLPYIPFASSTLYVPYTGGTSNVNLGAHNFALSGTSTLATTSITSLSLGDGLVSSYLAVNPQGLVIATTTPAGGGATPAGSDTQIQWNQGGTALGASAALTFSSSTNVLFLNGSLGIGSSSPLSKLTIIQNTTGDDANGLLVDGIANTANADIGLNRGNSSTTEANIDFISNGVLQYSQGLQNNNTNNYEWLDGSGNQIMAINHSTLDIGLGTDTPDAELTIQNENGGSKALDVLSSSGATQFLVNGAGQTSIGTSTTDGSLLYIASSTNLNLFDIASTTNPNANSLTILSNGYIGIGTSTPAAPFEVDAEKLNASVTATSTGILLINNTPATAAQQQNSPTITFESNGWGQAASTSQQAYWTIYNQGNLSGSAEIGNNSLIFAEDNGAASFPRFTLGAAGFATFQNGVNGLLYTSGQGQGTLGTTTTQVNFGAYDLAAASQSARTTTAPLVEWQGQAYATSTSNSRINEMAIGMQPLTGSTTYPRMIFSTEEVNAVVAKNEIATMLGYGAFGIGTSSPIGMLTAVGTTTNYGGFIGGITPDLLVLASSTGVPVYKIKSNGHESVASSTNTTPVLSACGTNPTIIGSDVAGIVTVGSVSATGCTITFAVPYTNVPEVQVTNETGSITNTFSYTKSTTAITVSATGLTGDVLDYEVIGIGE